MACTVLGAGSWGTALASQLARRGHDVWVWDIVSELCEAINRDHRNPRYLKDVALPENLRGHPDLVEAVSRARLLVAVVPSHALRSVMVKCADAVPSDAVIACATKGVEEGTLLTMHGLLEDTLPASLHPAITILSGPSFAAEVARGMPTAVVIGGRDEPAHLAAEAFHGDAFRCYHTEDVVGVCAGGSLKNVMAIACGVSDGIGLGLNARAAIITRGLAEMTRLAVAMGANPLTMMGLAGMGDLVLTCTGDLSRNRRVGLALGKGRTLDDILEELGEVAEGVITSRSARDLGMKIGVEMPITEQVYELIYKGKPAQQAMFELLARSRKAERDDQRGA
ncbi:MAG: NAD(P)-dependent glycerol-3-phosphate dehydrogenase [Deltaproteobacteria bacterium]|nr:NAD(P)-dependent glycerol-3-phosphate dehydrogenase [Deltaproteobacteria bacterium]